MNEQSRIVHLYQGYNRCVRNAIEANMRGDFRTESVCDKDLPSELNGVRSAIVEDGRFQVFENGRIFRITPKGKTECQIFKRGNGDNYLGVTYNSNGKTKKYYVHRLLAKAFLPNPDNKPYINHKDGNGHNNDIKNLEWCTQSYNIKHAHENNLVSFHKCIYCGSRVKKKKTPCTDCKERIRVENSRAKTVFNIVKSVSDIDTSCLNEKQKEAVLLRRKGHTLKVVGEMMGSNKKAVHRWIKQAKVKSERRAN